MSDMSDRFDITSQHPPQEQFLLFVDGELEAKEAARCTAHFDSCWECRVKIGKIEDTITEIIEFEQALADHDRTRDRAQWSDFDGRLRMLAASSLPPRRGWFLSGIFDRVSRFGTLPRSLVWGAPALAGVIIVAILLQSVFVSRATAASVLREAEAADAERSGRVEAPVIYRKVRVSTSERAEIVEFWTDATKLRRKGTSGVLDKTFDLSTMLAESGFIYDRPLSPTGHRLWSEKSGNSTELNANVVLEDGSRAFRITTSADRYNPQSRLLQASITIRDEDDHTVAESFVVRVGDDEKTYTVEEVSYKVISLNTLGRDFFETGGEQAAGVKPPANSNVSSKADTVEEPEKEQGLETTTVPAESASTELEVDVLAELARVRADLGEEITVTRRGGVLVVSGVVESAERKGEILSALAPYAANRSLRIDISTVAEAVARQQANKEGVSQTVDELEAETGTSPAVNQLIERLGSEAEARKFSARVVGRSREAMSHVYALRRLSRQFSARQVSELSPASRAKWAGLIRSHAASYRTASRELSREIAAVFGGSPISGPSARIISEPEDLSRAIEDLFGVASRTDRMIRASLTLSAPGRQNAGIGDRGFWVAVRNAEVIASAIAEFK